jgi:hypothetical protein
VRKALQACLEAADQHTARMVLVVEDGMVMMVSVAPPQLQRCVEPLVRSQTFPRTLTTGRQRITHTLQR